MCDTFSIIVGCISILWLAILTSRVIIQHNRVARIERFAAQSSAVWNSTFAICDNCTKLMFRANAPKIMHTADGTKYICEACKDAEL